MSITADSQLSAAPHVSVFGVRHHGPGSSRSVRAALEAFEPDIVLLEGPAAADDLVPLVAEDGMKPPVALLAYVNDEPRRAAFWPFAVFSPEWQALTWAVRRDVPVRFCDLPAAVVLAEGSLDTTDDTDVADCARETDDIGSAHDPGSGDSADHDDAAVARLRSDPIALLAAAAGFDDPERWWDDMVESRFDGDSPFEAIAEAMAELRSAAPAQNPAEQRREERREAHMRTVLRRALKDGHLRVAVVCGAWHAPALTGKLPSAASDAQVLKGAERRKV